MNTSRTQAPTQAGKVVMISATITKTRYRVRQTFFSFGYDCEETLDTTGEAEAYGRAIAEDLAQTFFQASEDYADIPLRSPFNAIGYSNETDFFARLCEDFSISGDEIRMRRQRRSPRQLSVLINSMPYEQPKCQE